MIRSLHNRLTLLMAVAIGVILLCTSGAALLVSERQLSIREQAGFDGQVEMLMQEVRMGRPVQSSALAKTEAANKLIISIWDNGAPIAFRGAWQPLTGREVLIEYAMNAAPAEAERWDGTLRGDHGERYHATVRRVSGYRSAQTVVMLKDMRAEDAQRNVQRWLYAGIAALGLIVLIGFSRFFTGRAISPIATAHEKQNQFVAAASHELRTPLQVMQIAVDALKQKPEAADRFAGQMQSELNRMSKLTENLMILTAAPERSGAEGGPVEVEELLEESAAGYHLAAAQKGVHLTYDKPAAPLPIVKGDAARLQRALNVLIDNAVCYARPGGHVSVSVTRQSRELWISVEDDGPGIEEEHRPHIFERFYRADKSRTDRMHSGLGLSIAKQIVEQHGGKLLYEPIEPHGSCFSVSLPFLREQKKKYRWQLLRGYRNTGEFTSGK